MSEKKIPLVDDEVIDPEEMFLTVELEDGSEETFQIMKIFEVNGQDYIAVCPVDGSEDVYFYRHFEDEDGEPYIDNIETDEEFEAVCDMFDQLLDEELFDEM